MRLEARALVAVAGDLVETIRPTTWIGSKMMSYFGSRAKNTPQDSGELEAPWLAKH
jgi:hypothetical protein